MDTRDLLTLTEQEIANVPWNMVRLTIAFGLAENSLMRAHFRMPATTLSTRLVNANHLWMQRAYPMEIFAMGLHPRLGAESLASSIAGNDVVLDLLNNMLN
jgi:hypothetical protein